MTTSVTIKNNGPHPVNVNEVEPEGREEKTVQSHSLDVGGEITLNIWSKHHYLNIIEQSP